MISYEDKVLQKVLKQFDGMAKVDAFDVLHKIEVLLNGLQSPIQYEHIKMKMDQNFLKNAVLPIGKRGYCYLVDFSQHLKIFEFKSLLSIDCLGKTLYFSTAKEPKLLQLTNENIRNTFDNSSLKYIIRQFLEENHVKKRNSKTKRLLLLELLDMVDNSD